jgi:hypothetical protein
MSGVAEHRQADAASHVLFRLRIGIDERARSEKVFCVSFAVFTRVSAAPLNFPRPAFFRLGSLFREEVQIWTSQDPGAIILSVI